MNFCKSCAFSIVPTISHWVPTKTKIILIYTFHRYDGFGKIIHIFTWATFSSRWLCTCGRSFLKLLYISKHVKQQTCIRIPVEHSLKLLYASLLPSEHTQHTENHRTEFHESCCGEFYRTIAKQFQFVYVNHTFFMATLHEDLHKFLCTWASASLICKSVPVLMLMDPCIIVQFTQRNRTRCNSVSKFIIQYLYEAQHVLGNTPPIIRSLKLHKQPLYLHTWKVLGRVVAGRWQLTE